MQALIENVDHVYVDEVPENNLVKTAIEKLKMHFFLKKLIK